MRPATRAPAVASRTARVTSAPAVASTRAVSAPIPEDAPVTTARRPCRSTPAVTSSAVLEPSKRVVMSGGWVIVFLLEGHRVARTDAGSERLYKLYSSCKVSLPVYTVRA